MGLFGLIIFKSEDFLPSCLKSSVRAVWVGGVGGGLEAYHERAPLSSHFELDLVSLNWNESWLWEIQMVLSNRELSVFAVAKAPFTYKGIEYIAINIKHRFGT